VRTICYEVKKDAKYRLDPSLYRFQLLCANCHEIKKKVEKQAQGARQHSQPALVRRSLQKSGEEPRRVKIRQADPFAANSN
jgi:hypothetical protein